MAIDFSMPRWLTEQHSFADSLLKGAQVGKIISDNRYRNQALAAQAIDAERNYALREKALTVDQEQKDIMIKSKLLEMETNKQMLADQVSDKETLSSWISERNQLSPEERLNMSVPNLRMPASFNAANQIFDNDRMAYQQSEKGRAEAAVDLAARKIPPSYVLRYYNEPDLDDRMQILKDGEEAARTATLDLYQPREMTTSEGEKVFYNPKTGTFRFAPTPTTDEITTRPITDETGSTIGHAMRSGDKWVRIPGAPRNPLENTLIKKRAELAGARKSPIGQQLSVPRLEAEVEELERAVKNPESSPATKSRDPLNLFGP